MKKSKTVLAFLPILFLFLVIPMTAQGRRWQMQSYYNIDLTEDQLVKIQELRLAYQKDILPLRTELMTGYMDLDNLYMQDADQQKIETTIAELEQMESELDKKFRAHQQQIREMLTDTQKVMFDRFGGLGIGFGRRMGYNTGVGLGGIPGVGRSAGWNRGMGYARGFGRSWGRGRGMGFNCPRYRMGGRYNFPQGWRFR